VSPREKHISDDAQRTSVCLTAAERTAIRWIAEVRRNQKSKRVTTNDVLVDALWDSLEKTHGKTREQIQAMIPTAPPKPQTKVTSIMKKKR
jgi:hypothetical protein